MATTVSWFSDWSCMMKCFNPCHQHPPYSDCRFLSSLAVWHHFFFLFPRKSLIDCLRIFPSKGRNYVSCFVVFPPNCISIRRYMSNKSTSYFNSIAIYLLYIYLYMLNKPSNRVPTYSFQNNWKCKALSIAVLPYLPLLEDVNKSNLYCKTGKILLTIAIFLLKEITKWNWEAIDIGCNKTWLSKLWIW